MFTAPDASSLLTTFLRNNPNLDFDFSKLTPPEFASLPTPDLSFLEEPQDDPYMTAIQQELDETMFIIHQNKMEMLARSQETKRRMKEELIRKDELFKRGVNSMKNYMEASRQVQGNRKLFNEYMGLVENLDIEIEELDEKRRVVGGGIGEMKRDRVDVKKAKAKFEANWGRWSKVWEEVTGEGPNGKKRKMKKRESEEESEEEQEVEKEGIVTHYEKAGPPAVQQKEKSPKHAK